MTAWLEVSDVAPRLGSSNVGTVAQGVITTGIAAAQLWIEAVLKTKILPNQLDDIFDLDRSQDWNGYFALKCKGRFITNVVVTHYPTYEDLVANNGTVIPLAPFQISKDGGHVLVPYTLTGLVRVTCTSGYEAGSIPADILEATIAYIPSVLKFAQTSNTDNSDYIAVIKTARGHALDLLSVYLDTKHHRLNMPIS